MKLRKERKERTSNTSVEKKSCQKKIGRIFNPCVRFLQYAIIIVSVYYLVIYTAIDMVPAIGGILGSIVSADIAHDFVLLTMNWLVPFLFAAGFLFVGEYWLIKKFVGLICKYADDLIEKYRVAQTRMVEEQAKKTEK